MDLHSCVVKLRSGGDSGIFTGEVPKYDLTTPEILILKAIHGDDAVAAVKKTGIDKRTDRSERDRLAGLYNNAGRDVVKRLFGESFNPLPKKLPAERVEALDLDADEMAA